jgi:hypothetical protein
MSRPDMVASLLRGFARHRSSAGKPDDHWLPPDIYDEELWDIDSIYLHIITDGSVGGPRPGGRREKSLEQPAAVTSCDVCDSGRTPRSESIFDDMKAHASRAIFGAEEAPAEDVGTGADGVAQLSTMAALMAELPRDLSHLEQPLSGLSLAEAASDLAASRPTFFAKLKTLGVERLAERQVLANGLAKARREGRIPTA